MSFLNNPSIIFTIILSCLAIYVQSLECDPYYDPYCQEIDIYKTPVCDPEELIEKLTKCQKNYLSFEENKDDYYYYYNEVDIKNLKVPSFKFCAEYEEYIQCIEQVAYQLNCEDKDLQLTKLVEEGRTVVENLKKLCLCHDSKSYYSTECSSPCAPFPCANDGECEIILPPKPEWWEEEWYGEWKPEEQVDWYSYGPNDFTCKCPTPFYGMLCENCKYTSDHDVCNVTCKSLKDCRCNKNYAGPFCNIACKEIKESPVSIIQACITEGFKELERMTYCRAPLQTFFAIQDCLAAAGYRCFHDAAYFIDNLLTTGKLKYLLATRILDTDRAHCFGQPPFRVY